MQKFTGGNWVPLALAPGMMFQYRQFKSSCDNPLHTNSLEQFKEIVYWQRECGS